MDDSEMQLWPPTRPFKSRSLCRSQCHSCGTRDPGTKACRRRSSSNGFNDAGQRTEATHRLDFLQEHACCYRSVPDTPKGKPKGKPEGDTKVQESIEDKDENEDKDEDEDEDSGMPETAWLCDKC